MAWAMLILCGLIGVASVGYRLQKSKPFIQASFEDVRFSENWCSGRSDRRLFLRWVVARNILWVAVTKHALHVSPHFPFSLMFLPEAFGWDHRIAAKQIVHVEEARDGRQAPRITIIYRHATGDKETLELWVDNAAGFIKALEQLRAGDAAGFLGAGK